MQTKSDRKEDLLNIWGLHVFCMIFIKTEIPKESADIVLTQQMKKQLQED